MGTIKIADLETGMTLAAPVFNLQGTMLLQKGAVITEKHIKLLKTWGIAKVNIAGIEEQTNTAQIDPDRLASCQRGLQERFSEVLNDDIMAAIFQAALEYFTEEGEYPWTIAE